MDTTQTATSRPRAVGRRLLAGYAVLAAAIAVYAIVFLSPTISTTVAVAVGSFTAALAGAGCLGGVVLILIRTTG